MKVEILQPAQKELIQAISYYNIQRNGLGSEFRDQAWQAIERIKKFPLAWSPLDENIRRCQLHHFPYGIIYKPEGDKIIVIAVAHLHRKPAYWHSRTH